MISANELRTGVTFEIDGQAFAVIQFTHIKPGKGSPFAVSYTHLTLPTNREV